ncbi:hypothetical protein TNCT_655821 [Trichonephila clavata]|uniref:Uncharacterized protein n=1 Tax=Trichonephila clavata TaxID=2740835 RepID=A0A8X6F749_TRICU|nr:hypothetical protein TNCT_655821 [Trichonephila clavata]
MIIFFLRFDINFLDKRSFWRSDIFDHDGTRIAHHECKHTGENHCNRNFIVYVWRKIGEELSTTRRATEGKVASVAIKLHEGKEEQKT